MPSTQVWTLQFLIDLQAREREKKRGRREEVKLGERGQEREGAVINSLLQKTQDSPLQVGS